ncbi:MAG: RNA polymerase sigma factor [Cellvibrio sp.]|nr:RNA polymerase sigma factor [Cellvibrio sp.]
MDESELIRRAQAGNADAFESLLETRYDTLYKFAFKWCGNKSDAEDVAQLACIKLAGSISQFRFESQFSSWLYRLVINCAKDWQKSQARHQGKNIDDIHQTGNEEEKEGHENLANTNPAENRIYLQQILQLLNTMADGFKETALLVHAEGLNHAEAAEVLGVKESTISWRLHEMRKQLQVLGLSSTLNEVRS